MPKAGKTNIYDELGLIPIINAQGNQTVLGGSMFGPEVKRAMESANRYFVDMHDLQQRAGASIADLVDCEAAFVTPGCAAALALGTAACIARDDVEKMARLPETTGMKRNVIIQARQRYHYERATTIVGARLIEVGDADGTTVSQLETAIDDDTAVVLVPAHLDGHAGALPLIDLIEVAHEHGVPVLVDAASQIYPVERLRSWTAMGADLVGFGAKYFGGGNSVGLLCGRKELVDSAAMQGFMGFEIGEGRGRVFGRPFKLDRQEIVAAVVALKEWVTMDHEVRIREIHRRVESLVTSLDGLRTAKTSVQIGQRFGAPALRLQIESSSGHTSESVRAALRVGSPRIEAGGDGGELEFHLHTVAAGDEEIIASRLHAILGD